MPSNESSASDVNTERIKRDLKWIRRSEAPAQLVGTKEASKEAAAGRMPVAPLFAEPKRHDRPENVQQFEDLMGQARRNPLVPIGMGLTVLALGGGLLSMVRSDSRKQQWFMRARIGAQAFTVATMVATVGILAYTSVAQTSSTASTVKQS